MCVVHACLGRREGKPYEASGEKQQQEETLAHVEPRKLYIENGFAELPDYRHATLVARD